MFYLRNQAEHRATTSFLELCEFTIALVSQVSVPAKTQTRFPSQGEGKGGEMAKRHFPPLYAAHNTKESGKSQDLGTKCLR